MTLASRNDPTDRMWKPLLHSATICISCHCCNFCSQLCTHGPAPCPSLYPLDCSNSSLVLLFFCSASCSCRVFPTLLVRWNHTFLNQIGLRVLHGSAVLYSLADAQQRIKQEFVGFRGPHLLHEPVQPRQNVFVLTNRSKHTLPKVGRALSPKVGHSFEM